MFPEGLSAPLLSWYDLNARAMPWRDRPDPYRVWVSEIMLQQTRVETVIPYFERFTSALPDIAALASAPEEQLLKLWEGLGYYSRVRNLGRAARIVAEEFGGQLPADPEQLAKLPGIGPYTAGAIASIAFGIPVPAVDGNVLRVIARLTADPSDMSGAKAQKNVADRIMPCIPPDRPGDFTQALMELGATVCLPKAEPLCGQCPLAGQCLALRQGNPSGYPAHAAARPRRVEERTVLLATACDGREILVRKRPAIGLLAGLWEFPHEEGWLTMEQAREVIASWGGSSDIGKPLPMQTLPTFRHIFTHLEWLLSGYCFDSDKFDPPTGWCWVPLARLRQDYALSTAFSVYRHWLEERCDRS